MDIVFANRISGTIYKECAKALLDEKKYTDSPIELRKRIEDCCDSYFEQHQMVI